MNKKKIIVNDKITLLLVIPLIVVFLLFSPPVKSASPTPTPISSTHGGEALMKFLDLINSFGNLGNLLQGSGSKSGDSKDSSGSKSPDKLSKKPNFVFYCQGNTKWKDNCFMGAAGCGPTSLAMVFSSFNMNLTPDQVDQVFRESKWRTCEDKGSFMLNALGGSWLKQLGFRVGDNLAFNGILDLKEAKKYLDQDFLIIGSSRNFPCANCKSDTRIDHIFVVDNVDPESGNVSIRDPNNCSYTDGDDENQAKRVRNVSDFTWFYAFPVTVFEQ